MHRVYGFETCISVRCTFSFCYVASLRRGFEKILFNIMGRQWDFLAYTTAFHGRERLVRDKSHTFHDV